MTHPLAPEVRGAQSGVRENSLRSALLAAALLLTSFASASPSELKPAEEATKPDFSLRDVDGNIFDLKALRGRTVLVHFFATWCEPCREEIPALNRLVKRSADNASIVAISVADPDVRVRRFFEHKPVTFPVLLDRDRAVARSWNVSALPTTYILDANMKPTLVVETDFQWDTIDIEPSTGKFKRNDVSKIRPDHSNEKAAGDDHGL